MANPTTNYGFVLPTSSDLVTDLPADFDVALQGVDTRLKALQPGTTLGDLAYSSATANTNTRLGVGSTGQVLTVAGGVPSWATPAGSGAYTSLATGTLSGATVVVSGLSGSYKDLRVIVQNYKPATDNDQLAIRFNNDSTASRHRNLGSSQSSNGAPASTFIEASNGADNSVVTFNLTDFIIPNYANTTTAKFLKGQSLVNDYTTTANGYWYAIGGWYNQTGAITGITFLNVNGGNFTSGDYIIYGVN